MWKNITCITPKIVSETRINHSNEKVENVILIYNYRLSRFIKKRDLRKCFYGFTYALTKRLFFVSLIKE